MLSPNTLIHNRYLVLRQIGRGGMGAVYQARDQRLGHEVALKQTLMTGEVLERAFEREARTLAHLRHPALPVVSDYFAEAEGQFLVMQYVPGDDLDTLLRRQGHPFGLAQVLAWADTLLDALEYLHSQPTPIIHRDIKPSNIKLSSRGEVLLLDFGLSKGGVSATTPVGASEGSVHGFTPHYAPLEQIEGTGTDSRSDLYALGATLYHLLTCSELPTAITRARAQVTQQPDPLRPANALNSEIPAEVAAVLTQAMALDLAQRPVSAHAMRVALRAAASAVPSTTPLALAETLLPPAPADTLLPTAVLSPTPLIPSPSSPPPARPARSLPFFWLVGAGWLLLLLVSAAVLGQFTWDTPEAALASPAAPTKAAIPVQLPVLVGTSVPVPLEALSPASAPDVEELARWGEGTVNGIAYAPDGSLLAVASSLGIYLYDPPSFEQRYFIESEESATSVAVSPDGELLAVGEHGGRVRLWKVSDGSLVRTLEGHKGAVLSVAFSPDGEWVASGSEDRQLRLWEVRDGTPLHTLEGHSSAVQSVAFSPDGEWVASGSKDKSVRWWEVAEGTPVRTLEELSSFVQSVAFSPDGTLFASGAWDGTIQLWQVSDGTMVRTIEMPPLNWVNEIAFSPDGEMIAVGAADETTLWRVSDGEQLRTLEGHTAGISNIAFDASRGTLSSASLDGTIRTWQVQQGTLEHTLAGYSPSIFTLAAGADGTLVAAGVGDQVMVRAASDGTPLRMVAGESGRVHAVSLSEDGTLLATGEGDNSIRLWRTEDGALRRTLAGHTTSIQSIAFSPSVTN